MSSPLHCADVVGPPAVEASTSWRRDYPRLSDAHPDAPGDVDAAVDYLADFVARIDNAD